MATTVFPNAHNVELPGGYTTTERIGSGGYGEVWRATAPGGVEKAIKIVYGHCSDDLAERELKSLERIRAVRHPFVISLERFEVVDGRLVIVTELADMSLDVCYRNHQEAGLSGIPRDELLCYLSDAADALDCLVERHSLQHLDIKPENLLVVGDHVKVGDFGLVKELATRTLDSMMGGMTPLYSAPEVFDDNPSHRSDQYSLAIVYQQMLTGQLPFPGRTPAQLAKQHTQAEPNLQPLAERDQAIMRRALAKRPEARFESCRAFVEALKSGAIAPATKAESEQHVSPPVPTPATDDTTPNAAMNTQPIPADDHSPMVTQRLGDVVEATRPQTTNEPLSYPVPDTEVHDLAPPKIVPTGYQHVPTLVVGIGGMGIKMLKHVREPIGRANVDCLTKGDLAWLAIDTDRETLNNAVTDESQHRLDNCDTLHIPLKRPKQYGDSSQALLRWVSRRWLYNIPRSLETRGYRPLGRIAAVDHAEPILRSLYARLQQLAATHTSATKLRVVVLAGTSGGTGSGTVVDIAQAARSLAGDLQVELQVDGVLAMPERAPGVADSLPIANFYSLLTELTHTQRHGNHGEHSPQGPGARFESDTAAFDHVYLVCVPPRTNGDERLAVYSSVADYLALDLTTPVGQHLTACRTEKSSELFRLRSFGCTRLAAGADGDALLTRADTNVMQCGHRRYTILLAADGSCHVESLKSQRPTTSIVNTAGDDAMLVTEGSGFDPLSIAARLAEFYPDIADAAGRLHTRDDIAWQDLRLNGGTSS